MQPLPPLSPQTKEPMGPADLAPLFPESLIMQEVSTDQWIDIPGEVIDIYRCGGRRRCSVHAVGAGARHPRAHLLQVRRGLTGRQPQAEHRRAAGVLQQAGGHPAHRHRDRRRPVGLVDGDGVQHVRSGVRRVHGEGVVRSEAVPADLHGDVRRVGRGLAERQDEQRPRDPGGTPRFDGFARHRDQRGGRGRGHPRRHELRAGQRARSRAPAPVDHRARGPEADGAGGRAARRRSSGCVGGGSNYAGLAYPFMASKLRGEILDAVPGDRARGVSRR